MNIHKAAGIKLWYELADCTAGLKTGRQIDFLKELSLLELATLGLMTNGLTLAYGNLLQHHQRRNEGEKRERVCVFENKLLRYGPFFALASFGGSKRELDWVNDVIQKGLLELEEFESGQRSRIAPSLQSQVWRLFSEKIGCATVDSWFIAKGLLGGS